MGYILAYLWLLGREIPFQMTPRKLLYKALNFSLERRMPKHPGTTAPRNLWATKTSGLHAHLRHQDGIVYARDLSCAISTRRATAYDVTSVPSGKTAVTYGAPQVAQQAPSFNVAPHEGHRVSSTSPHCTQRRPPVGDARSREGRYSRRPPTT